MYTKKFACKFLQKVNSVARIRTIGVFNPIRNRHKLYKKFKQSGQETDKDNFKKARFSNYEKQKENLVTRRKN